MTNKPHHMDKDAGVCFCSFITSDYLLGNKTPH